MKKKRTIFSIVSVILLLAVSITMYCSYDRIDKAARKQDKQYQDISYQMYENIFETNFVLANKIDILNNDSTSLKDKYLNINEELKGYKAATEEGYLEEDLSKFYNNIESWTSSMKYTKNLKYFAKNTANGKVKTNDKNLDPQNLASDTKNKLSKYRWYIKVSIDQEGKVSYDSIYGSSRNYEDFMQVANNTDITKLDVSEYYSNHLYDDEGQPLTNNDLISYKMPKNMEYVYAIPNNLVVGDEIYYTYNEINMNRYEAILIPYVLIGLAVVMLYMLFAPINVMKETYLFRNLIKIKLGFWMVLYGAVISLIAVLGPEAIYATQQGNLIDALKEINLNDLGFIIQGVLNIGLWAIFFGAAMFGVFHIKYIFHKGFVKYLKENTIIAWIIFKLEKLVNKVLSFDLREDMNNAVLKVVLVNFAIIVVISFVFGFGGFFFAIIYSIVIFVILRNKMDRIKYDYETLLKATKKLSSGDVNVEIDRDLGLFSSLGNEFVNIKSGFKKAVEEEVKSQKMRTELISNVSHDLKTPLTSIITYVDLLKKEDLTKEDEKQYIDTIDRNSQRLKNLIDDLFEMSKANSGNVNLNIVDVDIVSLIKQAQFECSDRIEEMGLECRMNFDEDKIICPLDSSKTYRIFENLLMNICKYALPNTRVYIDVKSREDEIEISFKNISANEIDFAGEEIVERFARGDKSRNSDGSGLGLAIAKSFTELQKGKFKVEVDGDLFKAIITLKR